MCVFSCSTNYMLKVHVVIYILNILASEKKGHKKKLSYTIYSQIYF